MPITSLFAGFNQAVRSMQQSQFALTVHSSNVANANDPNFTRRDVLPPSEIRDHGPGVLRSRDAFIEDQFRRATGVLGDAEIRRNILSKVEDIFGDPVDGGLRKAIDQFYDAFQGLTENPGDGVARLEAITAGENFAQHIRLAYQQVTGVEQTVNEELPVRVDEVNTQLEKIFDLNKRISELQRHRLPDADLRDQRDQAVDALAKLTGARTIDNEDGTIRVIVGSTVVLDGGPSIIRLKLVNGSNGPVPTWVGYPTPNYGGTGTIAGLVAVRDTELKQMKQEIDNLGKAVATTVNTQHRLGKGLDGVDGRDFFTITAAPADIEVVRTLKPEQVAAGGAAGTGEQSDGRNARLLANLGESPVLNSIIIPGQVQSPRVYYRNLVGWVGSRTKTAAQTEEVSKAHVNLSTQQRQAYWGVSLDEEVAKMTAEQKAFQAAARIISTMDEMLDTLINRTGR
ncbi:MAG TPA: flagellar hook-associated protein FlgK [Symbiobacteriaceae bacterium]|nr:flagellar hook-associated protein FlgK [Symbiobacteriaceae bacterium]